MMKYGLISCWNVFTAPMHVSSTKKDTEIVLVRQKQQYLIIEGYLINCLKLVI